MDKPPRVAPKIKASPKIRSIYWCDFWKDARLPEMWKKRPVLVVFFKNTLSGPCTVLPISTDEQEGISKEWAYKLPIEIQPRRDSWVVCNHLYTVSPSRFEQIHGTVPRLSEGDFNAILEIVFKWLPKIPDPILDLGD